MAEIHVLLRHKKPDGTYQNLLPVSTADNIIVDIPTNKRLDQELNEINLALLFNSAGAYIPPTITDNGNGSITLGDGDILLYDNADFTGLFELHTVTGTTINLVDSAVNYIVVDYNSGSPIFTNLSTPDTINESNIVPICTIYRSGNTLHIMDWDTLAKGLVNKIHRRIVKTQRFTREFGLTLAENTGRTVLVSAGTVWYGAVPMSLASFDSSVDTIHHFYHSGGFWTSSTVSSYNNSQYDNGTNLTTLTDGRYAVNWIYRSVENSKQVFMVSGTGDYTLYEAQNSQPPNVPTYITSNSILIGRIIVLKNATVSQQIDDVNLTFHPSITSAERDLVEEFKRAKPGFRTGCRRVYNSTTTIDIEPGEIEVGGVILRNASKLNIDWNKVESGVTRATNTWYYIYVTPNSTNPLLVDAFISTTLPTKDEYGNTKSSDEPGPKYHPTLNARFVGSVKTDATGSGEFINFTLLNDKVMFIGLGNNFILTSGVATTRTAVNCRSFVPNTSKVSEIYYSCDGTSVSYRYIGDVNTDYIVPDISVGLCDIPVTNNSIYYLVTAANRPLSFGIRSYYESI